MQLNCDLGEGFDEVDAMIMPLLDQANIACGGHTGDTASMQKAVMLARKYNVAIGAHPSYPDKKNFGRLSQTYPNDTLKNALAEQINALDHTAKSCHASLSYVKPHGALYNDIVQQPALLNLVLSTMAMEFSGMTLMVQATASADHILKAANTLGVKIMFEAFADRRYTPEGLLQHRSINDAVLTRPDDIFEQAKQILTYRTVHTTEGDTLKLHANTCSLCVHGDNKAALASAKRIRTFLNTKTR